MLPVISCRSLANARSLLLLYSSCGAVPSVSYRVICLDCLIGLVPRSPVFSIKAFQWTRCPAVLSIAVSWRRLFPSSRAICLLAALRSALRPVFRYAARLASRSASRLVLRPVPLGGCHRRHAQSLPVLFGLRSSIAPPCLSRDGERDGTGLPISPSPARLAAAAYPGWRLACVRFLVCGLLCLLVCRHLCLYCDGEIVYMICPVAII